MRSTFDLPGLSIETRDLTRVFKGPSNTTIRALDRVNIKVSQGEIFGLLGPNGAGKTTLIKILTTLLLPSEGEAFVAGFDVTKQASELRELINLVSGGETPGYGILSTRENLWFFSQLYGLPASVANSRIKELMAKLEFSEYANTRMHKLSSGYKQRLNLARGFINDPKVLFLDEPTLGLDVLSAKNLRNFVKDWVHGDSNRTILLTTHYMAEADEMCDNVAIVDHGKVLALDSPSTLKGRLQLRRTVKLEVRVSSPNLADIKHLTGVLAVSQSQNIETGITTVKAVVEDEAAISEMISWVSQSGSKVISVSKTEPTLEDVYISLVGRGFEESET
jgi:ABC-2 type transport system ATP-binding protein